MGINQQHSCLWRSIKLDIRLVYYAIEQNFRKQKEVDKTILRERPQVVIDANPIGYPFILRGIGPSKAVFVIAKEFAREGIDVLIVCDNENNRHHSKRATMKRKGERARARLELGDDRRKLTSMLRSDDSDTAGNLIERDKLIKSIRSNENDTSKVLPPNFIVNIQRLVSEYDCENKGKITVEETPFQADPDIARRIICGDADCIVSGDSDYQMYIGPNRSDMMVRFPSFDNTNLKLKSAILVTGQERVNRTPAIRNLPLRITPIFSNKTHALNT
jgi:hypothetical protein